MYSDWRNLDIRNLIGKSKKKQKPSAPSQTSTMQSEQRENFKVVIRVRPPLPREINQMYGFSSIVGVSQDSKSVTILEYLGAALNDAEREQDIKLNPGLAIYHQYTFDQVYDQHSTQLQIYDRTAKPAILSVLQGYNATMIAYGQTGTGKTFTMEGFRYNSTDTQRGIVPRAAEEIFSYIQSSQNVNATFMVRSSYLQIYNEVISDLLKPDRGTLQIREEKRKGVFVDGLSEWAVRSPAEVCTLIQRGQLSRQTASTKMNDISSRSHAVFIIILEQMQKIQGKDGQVGRQVKVGKLNLVDLAGSERVRVTGATGMRLEESKKINQSLSALGNVIAALTDTRTRNHIPYRDSKLTRLLEDSLGGNCKTTMIALISPANDAFGESLSTVKFANRAKYIRNAPTINEDVDQKTLLRKYENEVKKLREELEFKNKSIMEMQMLLEMDNQSRSQLMNDPNTNNYYFEQEEKKKLEDKIRMMSSQVLVGGKKLEETPQFRTALEEKQKIIRREYEDKLHEIERERQQIEEDKAQIDRYKHLLLRQRDIMIALTARLNERDETILQLQEELDAYDKVHKETEEALEYKQSRCEQLETLLNSHSVEVPPEEIAPINHYIEPKRYQPYDTDDQLLDGEALPIQMLTAEEKIEELTQIINKMKNDIIRGSPKLQNFEELQRQTEKLERERNTFKAVIETTLLPQIEHIQAIIGDEESQLKQEVSSLYRNTSLALSMTKVEVRKSTQAIQEGISEVPKHQRPLTVDEMLLLKKQEMLTKRQN